MILTWGLSFTTLVDSRVISSHDDQPMKRWDYRNVLHIVQPDHVDNHESQMKIDHRVVTLRCSVLFCCELPLIMYQRNIRNRCFKISRRKIHCFLELDAQ